MWNVPELEENDEDDMILHVSSPIDTHFSDRLDAQRLDRDDDIEEFITNNEEEPENDIVDSENESDESENDDSE